MAMTWDKLLSNQLTQTINTSGEQISPNPIMFQSQQQGKSEYRHAFAGQADRKGCCWEADVRSDKKRMLDCNDLDRG